MVVIGILITNQSPADWSRFKIQVEHHFYNIIVMNNAMSVRYSSIYFGACQTELKFIIVKILFNRI